MRGLLELSFNRNPPTLRKGARARHKAFYHFLDWMSDWDWFWRHKENHSYDLYYSNDTYMMTEARERKRKWQGKYTLTLSFYDFYRMSHIVWVILIRLIYTRLIMIVKLVTKVSKSWSNTVWIVSKSCEINRWRMYR